jgi:ABC-type multidrug transport system fused ATPase/permease subunit
MIHVHQNSSQTISSITNKSTTIVSNAIQPAITIISSAIMLNMILASLIFIDPFIAISALLGFLLIYLLVILLVKEGLKKNSKKISIHQVKTLKALQEGLNGIRDVLLDCNQEKYLRAFSNSESVLRRAYANTYVLGAAPRFGIEALGMILIAMIAYSVSESGAGVYGALPTLGALALGAQRILPLMQQIYTGWTSLQGGRDSIYDALEILCLKIKYTTNAEIDEKLPFEREIKFQDVSFRYDPKGDWVLKDVNISIPKGAIVGVIGESGAGKSTLLDLMMGLLVPTSGAILVDSNILSYANKRYWYKQVSHVPQSVFLADATIEENIAFSESCEKIDFQKIEIAISKAQLSGLITRLPEKNKTYVGERGARLSGGQVQRIGIARAIYKSAEFLVLDEATSSLDENTEIKIMDALRQFSKKRTVVLAAHRGSTLKYCTHLITVKNKTVFINSVNA